jgi:hypothetical protein
MTVTCFHRWIPAVRQSVYMAASASGRAAWAHLSSLYLTPLGPGAEVFVVDWRACAISAGVTSVHSQVGLGGGSSGCSAVMLIGFLGKKWAQRRLSFSLGCSAREPSSHRSAGKTLFTRPFRTLAMRHISTVLSILFSKLSAQDLFAFFIIWHNLRKAWRRITPDWAW